MKPNLPAFPNTVIRASAGTGKTFQLSNRFLSLVFAGAPVDTILATTFTRKAAGEILDRILLRLADAALDNKKLAELNTCLASLSSPASGKENTPPDGEARGILPSPASGRGVGGEGSEHQDTDGNFSHPQTVLPPTLSQREREPNPQNNPSCHITAADCRRVLGDMVRQLHRLRVGTLDSFFMQVAQTFSLELGFPPGWTITDEIVDLVLQRMAVRAVLHSNKTSDVLRLMHLLTKGEATRSVASQLVSLVQNLYGCYLESPAAAWRSLPRRKQLSPLELAEAMTTLQQVAMPAHKGFVNAHEKSVQDAAVSAWENFLSRGLAQKISAREEKYYNKPITLDIVEAYTPLIENGTASIIDQIANQNEATHELLERFDVAYQALKITHRAMRFDDLTRKLSAAEMAERLDDVLYRLDVRIAHLLLDEFQDTSPMQWRVLSPLARRAVDNKPGHSFFCVGDVKQAIYGWRGGVAEIFEALDLELPNLKQELLNHSWRSSPPVIDCVNQVFQRLPDNQVLQQHLDATHAWSLRFNEHSTERGELPGYCTMTTAPRAGENEQQFVVTLRHAAQEIARLHRQSPGCSIGVLVRRNVAVARLIYELRQHGVEASEEGGNPLTDSPAVELVLSLLTLADHPGDTVARFHLARSPLAKSLGIANHEDADAAWRLSLQVRQSLLAEGYGPTVYRWTKLLAPHCDSRDLSRLMQLVELAYAYESQASVRPDDFIALVRQKRIQDPGAADIRVMSVHQSKGLQFDIVVLPELDVRMGGQPPQIVVNRPTPVERIDRVCRYVSQSQQMLLPGPFQDMFKAAKRQTIEESLCVLYVAMTRAIHALHVIVAPSRNNEKTIPDTWAGVLRAALTEKTVADPKTLLYEHGDPKWCAKLKKPAAAKTTPAAQPSRPQVIRLAENSPQMSRGLDRLSPSQLEGGRRVELVRQLRFDVAPQLDRGTLLHAWFQQVEWLDEGQPQEDVLRSIAVAPKFSELNVNELLDAFYASLKKPAIRRALSRSTYQKPPDTATSCGIYAADGSARWRWQVWRERPFAIRQDNTILNGSIDRLTALYDGDRIVAADVMDFKSDALSSDDAQAVAARVEFYRPQLEAYRQAASKLCRLAPEQISLRLLFIAEGFERNL